MRTAHFALFARGASPESVSELLLMETGALEKVHTRPEFEGYGYVYVRSTGAEASGSREALCRKLGVASLVAARPDERGWVVQACPTGKVLALLAGTLYLVQERDLDGGALRAGASLSLGPLSRSSRTLEAASACLRLDFGKSF